MVWGCLMEKCRWGVGLKEEKCSQRVIPKRADKAGSWVITCPCLCIQWRWGAAAHLPFSARTQQSCPAPGGLEHQEKQINQELRCFSFSSHHLHSTVYIKVSLTWLQRSSIDTDDTKIFSEWCEKGYSRGRRHDTQQKAIQRMTFLAREGLQLSSKT